MSYPARAEGLVNMIDGITHYWGEKHWYFSWSTSWFSFFSPPNFFYSYSWQENTSYLASLHNGLPSWVIFTIFSIVSVDSSYVGVMFLLNYAQLLVARTVNYKPIRVLRFVPLFVLWMQITRSIHFSWYWVIPSYFPLHYFT